MEEKVKTTINKFVFNLLVIALMLTISEIYQIETEIVATQLEAETINGTCVKVYKHIRELALSLESAEEEKNCGSVVRSTFV